MSIVSIAIQKGGSGKTTTAVNLPAALLRLGKRILLVDADPQVNLSQSLGIRETPERNLYTEWKKEMEGGGGQSVAEQQESLRHTVLHTASGLDLLPGSPALAETETELVSAEEGESLLSDLLQPIVTDYDFVFIDCPSALGMLTRSALVASRYVLMPLQAEFLPLNGARRAMDFLSGDIAAIRSRRNATIDVLGFVFNRYDDRRTINRRMCHELEEEYPEKVFRTRIRTNIQLSKAQEAGLDIFSLAPRSNGAVDYAALAKEFLSKLKNGHHENI
ncbi:MAG TPA: ParA family protein [Puia sp.]|nr:ParA family protein [Puia sp.]